MPPPRGCRVCWSMQTILWIAVVLCPTVWHLAVALESLSAECSEFKFFVLEYNDIAGSIGLEPCITEDNVVVEMATGTVFSQADEHFPGSPGFDKESQGHHKFGAHAAPWLLLQDLRESGCVVSDIEAAHWVYVDMYCPYITWLGAVHFAGMHLSGDTPGDDILEAYDYITDLPRWHLHGGRDFIFFDPHPGFALGTAAYSFREAWCQQLRDAIQLVPDSFGRSHCLKPDSMPSQLVPVPYAPNVVDIHHASNHRYLPNMDMRPTLLYARMKCATGEADYMGKQFRSAVVKALEDQGEDVDVRCSNGDGVGGNIAFRDMLHATEHSIFALALPGDSPSSRRLSEIFLAGSIPVFVGPPFHTMPFAALVDYSDAGLVFNITGPKPWLGQSYRPLQNPLPLTLEAPGAENLDIIEVPDIQSVLLHLQGLPDHERGRKLGRMRKLHSIMSYADTPAGYWNANKAIMLTLKAMLATNN